MRIIVNVNGVIGQLPDGNGGFLSPFVTFLDVVRQVESNDNVTEIDVFVNSIGGFVEEGDEIYNYLLSLKSRGIKVTTHAEDVCASIATKVFLAGDVRIINSVTEFMIHNPFGATPEGDADEIEKYYKELRAIENDMINFYSQRTGTSKEAIKPLMKKETFLTPEQAVELGFATEVQTRIEVQALAFSNKFNNNLNTSKSKQMAKETLDKKGIMAKVNELLEVVKNFGNDTKTKGLKIVLDANAGDIEFPDLNPDDTPAIDDKTTANDGEYVMPNGETYVIVDGSLKEIKPADESEEETDESEELAAANQKIADLTKELEQVTALKEQNKQLKSEAKAQKKEFKALAKGLKQVQRSIGSGFDHKGEKKNLKKEGETKPRVFMKSEED